MAYSVDVRARFRLTLTNCQLTRARIDRSARIKRSEAICHEAFFGLSPLLPAVIVVPQRTIRHDDEASDIPPDLPLSVESARSVRQASIAIRYHGVRYLPVLDDGCLVGIVAFREELPRPRRDP